MKKKLCLLLALALTVAFCSGCKPKTPEEITAEKYAALAEVTLSLVETYNSVAQTAIDNGWEADFQTLKLMDEIADKTDIISAAVNDPTEIEDMRLDAMAQEAQKLIDQLNNEVLPKVSEPCEVPGEEVTGE